MRAARSVAARVARLFSPLSDNDPNWFNSGDDICYTAGNVGIGTTTPYRSLEVAAGGADAYTNGPTLSLFDNEGYSGTRRFTLQNAYNLSAGMNSLIFNLENDTGGLVRRLMILQSGGNVGIGTTSPAGTLDVRGGTASSGNGVGISLYAQSGQASGNTDGGNIILMPGAANGAGTAGRVGIGTASPAHALDVAGDGHFSGALTVAPVAPTILANLSSAQMASTGYTYVQGELCYASSDGGAISIIDFSVPASPRLIGQIVDPTNLNHAEGIVVVGHLIYLAVMYTNTVYVLDSRKMFIRTDLAVDASDNTKVSSAGHPFTASDIGYKIYVQPQTGWTPDNYTITSVAGGVATLSSSPAPAGTTGGSCTATLGSATVLRNNDPTNLDYCENLVLSGSSLLVSNYNNTTGHPKFVILSPASLAIIASTNDSRLSGEVYADDELGIAYVTSRYANSFSAIDVDPSSPTFGTILGSLTDPSLTGATVVEARKGWAYVAGTSNNKLVSIDIGDPTFPTRSVPYPYATSLDATGFTGPSNVRLAGTTLYVTFYGNYGHGGPDSGIAIYDVSSPTAPVLKATLAAPSGVYFDHLDISGRIGLAANTFNSTPMQGGIVVLDLGGIDSPAGHIGRIQTDDLEVIRNQRIGGDLAVGGSIVMENGAAASRRTFSASIDFGPLLAVPGTTYGQYIAPAGSARPGAALAYSPPVNPPQGCFFLAYVLNTGAIIGYWGQLYGATTSGPAFTGSGLNDATSGGDFTRGSGVHTLTFVIDGTGAPDTFKVQIDGDVWITGIAITGAHQVFAGVWIQWAATTGHTLGDKWVVTVAPAPASPDGGVAHNYSVTVLE